MLVENLYNCSANLHSGSGIGRGSSYNCFAGDRRRPRAHGARRGGLSARSRHAAEILSPTAISPSLTMSARRPPRWCSAQRPRLAVPRGQALEVRAGLAQALAEALDVADAEPLPDERVEIDAARDHVAPGVLRGERRAGDLDRVEHLGRHQRQVVAARVDVRERPLTVEVAVARQAAAGARVGARHALHRRLGARRDDDRLDPSGRRRREAGGGRPSATSAGATR